MREPVYANFAWRAEVAAWCETRGVKLLDARPHWHADMRRVSYMRASLRDVVDHYANISPDRLHSDGEAILKPLHLSERETRDLVAFLESLQDGGGGYHRIAFAADCR